MDVFKLTHIAYEEKDKSITSSALGYIFLNKNIFIVREYQLSLCRKISSTINQHCFRRRFQYRICNKFDVENSYDPYTYAFLWFYTVNDKMAQRSDDYRYANMYLKLYLISNQWYHVCCQLFEMIRGQYIMELINYVTIKLSIVSNMILMLYYQTLMWCRIFKGDHNMSLGWSGKTALLYGNCSTAQLTLDKMW